MSRKMSFRDSLALGYGPRPMADITMFTEYKHH